MSAVAKLPAADMFAPLSAKIDDLKLRRGASIKAAMMRRDMAASAAEKAQAARAHALQEVQLAEQDLKQLMEVGERVVIGDQLITMTANHGVIGVIVQPVTVLGLI